MTPAARIGLFIQVCQAVQHAHTKGVIHRDIKPSNVLVTLHDGVPVPKVIDFGIAKATSADLTDRTLFTEFRQMVGTPAYMSPEQAEMSGLDVDTRSDVYSLGVLLYELLTGTTPFDAQALKRAGVGEMQRILREEEPPRPSTRLSTLDDVRLTNVARERGTEPGKLGTLIRGDLDWIVMTAMEKDRTRRYETATGLAADLRRYLADEPIAARPPTAGYRLRKLVRRHRAAVAAGAAVAAALVVGIAGTTAGMVRARAARQAADAARVDAVDRRNVAVALLGEVERAKVQAERQARRAEAANAFMRNMLASARPATRPSGGGADGAVAGGGGGGGGGGGLGVRPGAVGADVRVVDVLHQAGRALDGMAGQPELELDGRLTLARTFEQLGDMASARGHYERALALSRASSGAESEQTLQVAVDLGYVLTNAGGRAEAAGAAARIGSARETADLIERRLGPGHPLTVDALNNVALALRAARRLPAAEEVLRDVVRRVREAKGAYHPKGSARYYSNLALVLDEQGRNTDEVDDLRRETAAAAAAEPHTDARRAVAFREQFARSLWARGRTADAAREYRGLVAQAAATLGRTHDLTLDCESTLALIYDHMGRHAESADAVRQILDALPEAERDAAWLIPLRFRLGMLELRAGRSDAAVRVWNEALAADRKLTRADPGHAAAARARAAKHELLFGTRIDRPWASPALGRLTEVVAWDGLSSRTTSEAARPVDWSSMTFRFDPWTGGAADGVRTAAGSVPAPAAARGELAALRALADPAPGAYLMSVSAPRSGAGPLRIGRWVLIAPWEVEFYPMGAAPDGWNAARLESVFRGKPVEARRESALAYYHLRPTGSGFGPFGQADGYGLSATTSVRLPPGRYALNLRADGAARAWVDGALVHDGWDKAAAMSPEGVVVEFGDAARAVKVQVAGGGEQLFVGLEPLDAGAEAMRKEVDGATGRE